jgi:predicted permease
LGEIAGRLAPIFVMLALGWLFKKKAIMGREAVSSLKGFVARVSLPAVVFGAFSAVPMDRVTGVTDALFKRRSVRPFLLTAFEAGMLGLPLFSIFYGPGAVPRIAMADLGEICFTFLVLIPMLNQRSGGERGIRPALARLASNPVIWSVLLGLASAATGLSRMLAASSGGQALFSTLSFIGAPTGALILFVVGYDLDFSRKSLGAALPTVALRYAIMVPLFFAVRAAVGALALDLVPGAAGIEDGRIVRAALMFLFLMPSTFAIPVFGKEGEESEYISTTLSLNTLVTVILLALLAGA